MNAFDSVKVFSATKARERDQLGERATEWLRKVKPRVTDVIVKQSSDREFHCMTLVFFYKG